MVDNIVTKAVGLVLITTAHMISNGSSQAGVTGTLGSNITLQFRFNDTVLHRNSHFAVYVKGERKIYERKKAKACPGGCFLNIDLNNASVEYHITNLRLNHSDLYWVSLFDSVPPIDSNKVQLIVKEENRSSTVPPLPTNITIIEDSGSSSFFSFHNVIVLVVLPVVLLAAALPLLIWCLVITKEQQQPQQQNSNPTVQETSLESNRVPPPSLVYSILDFPKRPSPILGINPNDTEYAAVNYLPENRV
ncbi:uncharacterized protein LOC130170457 [Seriola aureovittata]|uniref:uncharacterized protein LOC130170457 n=1 Tax=Seriola aureovittata TaxID=2871759 RepID=UPI0024BE9FA6|nr:uncharacterized protein LOC130170457 [Seriola aureovittata]